ncbi:peroxide stress protein YaaA [soil metagenome]
MLLLLSPAKSLDFDSPAAGVTPTEPQFLDRSAKLIGALRKVSVPKLQALMDLSDSLARLNVDRYKAWQADHTAANSRPAAFAFDGDVYGGLRGRDLSPAQLNWAQDHLRILSGLYGVLRPLDRIQPHRLEMGTKLASGRTRDLYGYWGEQVSKTLADEVATQRGKARSIVNCASEEYFKVVRPALLGVDVVHTIFEERKPGRPYRIVSFHAKRARGLMARYMIENRINDPDKLKGFDVEGYAFAAADSAPTVWRFRREGV